MTEVQQITNPNLDLLGAIATIYDARTTHSRDVLADVADRYDLSVINPPIPRTVRFAEASASACRCCAAARTKAPSRIGNWPRICGSTGPPEPR